MENEILYDNGNFFKVVEHYDENKMLDFKVLIQKFEKLTYVASRK